MKKHIIDINSWSRREQYLFFSTFEEPFFGIISKVDCTQAYDRAKAQNKSFFSTICTACFKQLTRSRIFDIEL